MPAPKISFVPHPGHGFVVMRIDNATPEGGHLHPMVLAYPRQNDYAVGPLRVERIANEMNEAVEALNEVFARHYTA